MFVPTRIKRSFKKYDWQLNTVTATAALLCSWPQSFWKYIAYKINLISTDETKIFDNKGQEVWRISGSPRSDYALLVTSFVLIS
jgi:hypothetical protein